MEYFYHCQGTETADEMLEMPFIIVHSNLVVASHRLLDTESHANSM